MTWNPAAHPRHPDNAPAGKGGEFMPKLGGVFPGKIRLVNTGRSPYGEYRADLEVNGTIVGTVTRASKGRGGGGYRGESYRARLTDDTSVVTGETIQELLADIREEFGPGGSWDAPSPPSAPAAPPRLTPSQADALAKLRKNGHIGSGGGDGVRLPTIKALAAAGLARYEIHRNPSESYYDPFSRSWKTAAPYKTWMAYPVDEAEAPAAAPATPKADVLSARKIREGLYEFNIDGETIRAMHDRAESNYNLKLWSLFRVRGPLDPQRLYPGGRGGFDTLAEVRSFLTKYRDDLRAATDDDSINMHTLTVEKGNPSAEAPAAAPAAPPSTLPHTVTKTETVDEFTRRITFQDGVTVTVLKGWKRVGGNGWVGEHGEQTFPTIREAAQRERREALKKTANASLTPLKWKRAEDDDKYVNDEGRYEIIGIPHGTWNYDPDRPTPMDGWVIWDSVEDPNGLDESEPRLRLAEARAEVERRRRAALPVPATAPAAPAAAPKRRYTQSADGKGSVTSPQAVWEALMRGRQVPLQVDLGDGAETWLVPDGPAILRDAYVWNRSRTGGRRVRAAEGIDMTTQPQIGRHKVGKSVSYWVNVGSPQEALALAAYARELSQGAPIDVTDRLGNPIKDVRKNLAAWAKVVERDVKEANP